MLWMLESIRMINTQCEPFISLSQLLSMLLLQDISQQMSGRCIGLEQFHDAICQPFLFFIDFEAHRHGM